MIYFVPSECYAMKPISIFGFLSPSKNDEKWCAVAKAAGENNFLNKDFERFSKLTKREKQVLQCMSLGRTAAEVSNELHISVATAETHRENIRRKLNINSSFDLI